MKNHQLNHGQNGQVRFSYHSHQRNQRESLQMAPAQFLLRLAQHVPVAGKPVLRYFGLYASAARAKLNAARTALGQAPIAAVPEIDWHDYLAANGWHPTCQICDGPLLHRGAIERADAQ